MSLAPTELSGFPAAPDEVLEGVPPAERVLAPDSVEEAARMLEAASDARARVLLWGGGTHQGYGARVEPDVVVVTTRLDRVLAWEPDDLTLVVEAGARVAAVEEMLAARRQTAVLPEAPGDATVGGVVAAGVSGYRRARYGPTRDRMLEVTLATGDGRVVRGGGRVVKNVTGYDLPRLATGSLGALGMIGAVCLKLWPLPEASATMRVDDPQRAWRVLYRPLAVLETPAGSFAFLAGTRAEVESQAAAAGGEPSEGLHWPPQPQGRLRWSLRVPPADTAAAVERLPGDWSFVAQHGVGVVECASPGEELEAALELRAWAESRGGGLVLAEAPAGVYDQVDPWGAPPPALHLQRRVVAAFDPLRVVNPGRLPGGI